MIHRARASLLVAALAASVVAGCGSDGEPVSTSTAPVIQPGAPGEPAETLPPGTEFTATQPPYSEADVAFAVGMIPHHQQALEMAALAPDRAESESVKGLASRIYDVQGPEIEVFRGWLAERGLGDDGRPVSRAGGDHGGGDHGGDGGGHPGGDGGGHQGDEQDGGAGHGADHADMPGMASAEEMARLESARGPAFDRLWLELMIRHHQGALAMSEQRAEDGGVDIRADELAADVYVSQLDEIQRMEQMLAAG